jgi:hypothetical protein
MTKHCNSRKPWAFLVLAINIGFIAVLILSLVLLILFQRKEIFAVPGRIDSSATKFVSLAMIGFCIGIVASVFGIGLACVKHRVLSVLYGAFLLPVPVLYVIAMRNGGRFTRHSMMDSSKVTEYCAKVDAVIDPTLTPPKLVLFEYASQIDKNWQANANKWMCSSQCPCNPTVAAKWLALDESVLKSYGRTKNTLDKNDSDGTVLLSAIAPTGKETDYFPTDFIQCFTDWKADWTSAGSIAGTTPLPWYSAAQSDFEALSKLATEGNFEFLRLVEKTNTCAGICKKGLFYVTLGLEDANAGIPTTRCFEGVLEDFSTAKPVVKTVGAVALISFILWLI